MIGAYIKEKLYIDHIVLTITDIGRTLDFYSKIMGKPDYKNDFSIMYEMGRTKLFFSLPYDELPPGDKFNANRIGLEHLAIGIQTLDDLKEIEKCLDQNLIKHSGIHTDKDSLREKIWLDDPDKIRLEFYIRSL